MFETISNFLRVGEIRNKILFTLLMLIVFRIGTFIPVPNVNAEILAAQDQLSVFGVLNTFGGGALKTFPFLLWGSCLILRHRLSFNYYRWMLYPSLQSGQNKGKLGVVN